MAYTSGSSHEAFVGRHPQELKQLYKDVFPNVRKFVISNNGSADDAWDVFQEAVMAAWLNIQNGKFNASEGSSLAAYIAQIARYKWLDQLKSGRRRLTSRLDERIDPADGSEEIKETTGQDDLVYLSRLYATLGEQCRAILSLFYYERRSLEEIGQQLNYDAATLRTMKYRCMMKLRKKHLENQQKSAND